MTPRFEAQIGCPFKEKVLLASVCKRVGRSLGFRARRTVWGVWADSGDELGIVGDELGIVEVRL